jgi:hypothetical protein
MIGKTAKAGPAIVSHVLGKAHGETLPVGMEPTGPRAAEAEFRMFESRRRSLKVNRCYMILSLAPGEHLTSQRWCEVVERYMDRMGYRDAPWFAVLHHDAPHEYVDIIASRVCHDGQVVKDFQERVRSREVIREFERELGLRETAPAFGARKKGLTQRETRRGLRTVDQRPYMKSGTIPELPAKAVLQRLLDRAAEGRPTVSTWVRRLEVAGVEVRANLQSTGRVAGVSFSWGGASFKGSDLGRDYVWEALSDRIDYDPERDASVLEKAAERSEGRREAAGHLTASASTIMSPLDVPPPSPTTDEPVDPPGDVARIHAAVRKRVASEEFERLVSTLGKLEDRLPGLLHTIERVLGR